MRSSSLSKIGAGEPFSLIARRIFGMPVDLPSARVELLQKLANAAVAVTPADCAPGLQICHADRPVGAGKAQDRQFLRRDAYLDWLSLLVRAVVDRVD